MHKSINPEDCQIRLMTLQDVDKVSTIENLAYAFPWPKSIFVDSLIAGFRGQVITANSIVCGYIFTQHGANECHILNLCVDPEFQKNGLASKMLALTLDKAKADRDQRVYLEVRESNVAALHLYEKYGFTVVGRRKDYYPAPDGKEDALLLTKELLKP